MPHRPRGSEGQSCREFKRAGQSIDTVSWGSGRDGEEIFPDIVGDVVVEKPSRRICKDLVRTRLCDGKDHDQNG